MQMAGHGLEFAVGFVHFERGVADSNGRMAHDAVRRFVHAHGLGAESIVWTLMFGLMPLACVYYPVTVLPHWLQYVAWALPPTYAFEGMRTLLTRQEFRGDLMAEAFAINVLLLVASFTIFLVLLRSARKHGSLLQSGE